MSTVAGEVIHYELKSGKRDRLFIQARAVLAAVGAVVLPLAQTDDPGFTIVRGGTAGLYNLTFPKSADAFGSIDVQTISAAGTVRGFYTVAADFAAGTAQIQIANAAGAATDPAVGDALIVSLILSMRRDF